VNDRAVDIVDDGFDAGIRIIEAVERDMVAVSLTEPVRWVVVGAPAYFARRGRPAVPEDLSSHDCIRYRFPASGTLYRWEFESDGREFSIAVGGGLVVDDGVLAVDFVRAGMGFFYTSDWAVRSDVDSGRLELVLQAFAPRTAGLQLYFPQRTQSQPKLRAFIETARRVLREP
jgi:DNA-binding transcriptional LysR family regulator